MADQKGLALRTTPLSSDRRLGYPAALSRVLLNLVTNGLKFTDRGFVEIATYNAGPSRVEFSVRDSGCGLDMPIEHTLYQPFRRISPNGGYSFSGSGLGLAICRRLLTAMHSELQHETGSSRGTRFYFELDLPPATTP
jgi:signal transduction histidine kinase